MNNIVEVKGYTLLTLLGTLQVPLAVPRILFALALVAIQAPDHHDILTLLPPLTWLRLKAPKTITMHRPVCMFVCRCQEDIKEVMELPALKNCLLGRTDKAPASSPATTSPSAPESIVGCLPGGGR